MHVMIPDALTRQGDADRGAAARRLEGLSLPRLQALVRRLRPEPVLRLPPDHPIAAHEHLLAQALGLDPAAPAWAARRAHQLGLPGATSQDWGWLTLTHWELGQSQVSLRDPAELDLQAAETASLMKAMAPFFAEDGLTLHEDGAGPWLVQGPALRGWISASPQRLAGHDVAPWLPPAPAMRRLQSEMQMLLYTHPVNDVRSARAALAVNGFWLHGLGALREPPSPSGEPPEFWTELQQAAFSADPAAWTQAWQEVDHRLTALLEALDAGQPVRLVLCSDTGARIFSDGPRPWWQRLRGRIAPTSLSEILTTP